MDGLLATEAPSPIVRRLLLLVLPDSGYLAAGNALALLPRCPAGSPRRPVYIRLCINQYISEQPHTDICFLFDVVWSLFG